jgi:hypothetical protein
MLAASIGALLNGATPSQEYIYMGGNTMPLKIGSRLEADHTS